MKQKQERSFQDLLLTEGLVIRQVDVGDKSRIIDIITPEHGKLSAYVPGVKSVKSRRLSACSVFCYSKFSLYERGGRYTVSQAQIKESFYDISADLCKTALGYYVCEIVGFVTNEGDDCGNLIPLCLNTLYALKKRRTSSLIIKSAFELRLLSLLGFMPDLEGCNCGKNKGGLYFSPKEGGLFCSFCFKEGKMGLSLPVSLPVLQAMKYIISCNEKRLFSFKLSDEFLLELNNIAETFTLTQLEHSFKSLEFFKSLT